MPRPGKRQIERLIETCDECGYTHSWLISMRTHQMGCNFSFRELACQCGCGHTHMDLVLLSALQVMRFTLAVPLRVTSGYRCREHPAEKAKPRPGYHYRGMAVDIATSGAPARRVLSYALKHEYQPLGSDTEEGMSAFRGIGIQQKGPWRSRFLHLDVRKGPRVIWTY